jgi:holo-[acyl-carrier protein] synthase
MSSFAVGVDIIELERVAAALKRHGGRFVERVYTPLEAAVCRGRLPELAARFAAKEAVMKALGTGARGVAWREIEVLPNRRGKPLVYLHGRARERAARIGLDGLDVSMSHSRRYAVAFVVASTNSTGAADREAWREKLVDIVRARGWLGENAEPRTENREPR